MSSPQVPQVEPVRCEVNLDDLLDSYRRIAAEAGVMPLLEENDTSVFRCGPPVLDRERWDPGVGSSWEAIPKRGRKGPGGREGGRQGKRVGGGGWEALGQDEEERGVGGGGLEAQGQREDVALEEGMGCEVSDWEPVLSDSKESDAGKGKKTKGKRKRPRGPGSKRSRKRGGRELRLAGSNAAARKVRITDKWIGEGTTYQTSNYSILQDGSHSSTGWQGRAPPIQKRRDVLKAYKDGSIVQVLGTFFPVPYEQ